MRPDPEVGNKRGRTLKPEETSRQWTPRTQIPCIPGHTEIRRGNSGFRQVPRALERGTRLVSERWP